MKKENYKLIEKHIFTIRDLFMIQNNISPTLTNFDKIDDAFIKGFLLGATKGDEFIEQLELAIIKKAEEDDARIRSGFLDI